MTKVNVVKFLTLFSLFSQKINSIISRFYKKFSLNDSFFAFVPFFLHFICKIAQNKIRFFAANNKTGEIITRFTSFLPFSVIFPYAVAHAHFRENILGITGLGFNFAADVGHIHPQDLVVCLGFRPP